MHQHDDARRAFLKRAAAVAMAGAAGVPDALAQGHDQQPEAATAGQAHGSAPHAAASGYGAFFNENEAATIAAFAERLMPGAPGKPGAIDAGVLNYIDLALAGAYSDQQNFYRRGLAALDAYSRKTYNESFVRLGAERQDEVLKALDEGKATGFDWPRAQAFFNTVRVHTLEGMFADPIYGGNKDFAGWRLIGFPGAYPAFTPEDMASKEAFTGGALIGMQSQAKRA
jgi:gluconate 2-dehydrogenase gamma chain